MDGRKKAYPEERLEHWVLDLFYRSLLAPIDMSISVRFGSAVVTKDGELIHDGELEWQNGREPWTVQDAESAALADPNHDWRIVKYGPLHGETIQRHGAGKWVCIETNRGFA